MLLGILLAAIIVVCIALVGVILLQRSEGGVLGMSGGGPGNFMSARGTGDLLTRTTQILAGVFFALCLLMTIVAGHVRRDNALANQLKSLSINPPAAPAQPAPAQGAPAAAPAPLAPAAPAPSPAGDGLNLFGTPAKAPPAHAAKAAKVEAKPARTASAAPASPPAPTTPASPAP